MCSTALQTAISGVTGDDAAMAVMGVGTDFKGFQALLAPRLAELERTIIGPLDGLRSAVDDAERALQQARQQHETETAGLWRQYQVGYERHRRAAPDDLDDEAAPLTEDESPDHGAEPADKAVGDGPADVAEGGVEPEAEAEPDSDSERRAEVTS